LWSLERQRANRAGRNAVVLIGTSRFLTGLDPAVLNQEIPARRFLQLAIGGSSPFPVLDDLAKDPLFRGNVICEVHPGVTFRNNAAEQIPRAWLDFFHHRGWVADTEAQLRILLQQRLTLELADVTPTVVLRGLLQEGRLPKPNYVRFRADRFLMADYGRVDVARQMAHWLKGVRSGEEPLTEPQLRRRCAQINESASRIQQHGGQVVFLRMVSSGELYKAEEQHFPRERYWSVFVRSVSAPAIDFKEVPALARSQCAEGSHLDYRVAQRFSQALAAELVRRGLLVSRR